MSLLDMAEKRIADTISRRQFGALVPGLESYDDFPQFMSEEIPDLGLPRRPFEFRRIGGNDSNRYYVERGWIDHLLVAGTGQEVVMPATSGRVIVTVEISRSYGAIQWWDGSSVPFLDGGYTLSRPQLVILPTNSPSPNDPDLLWMTLFTFTATNAEYNGLVPLGIAAGLNGISTLY